MHTKITNDQLTVLGDAGTHVVLLGMSLPKAKAKGLRGFGLRRTAHATGEGQWLRGAHAPSRVVACAPQATFVSHQQRHISDWIATCLVENGTYFRADGEKSSARARTTTRDGA